MTEKCKLIVIMKQSILKKKKDLKIKVIKKVIRDGYFINIVFHFNYPLNLLRAIRILVKCIFN